MIEAWIRDSHKDVDGDEDEPHAPHKVKEWRQRVTRLAVELQRQQLRHRAAKLDFNLLGRFPTKAYDDLLQAQQSILGNLIQLYAIVDQLSPPWRRRLISHSLLVTPGLISDVNAVLLLCSRSLRTSQPLNEVLPSSLVDRVFVHASMRTKRQWNGDEDLRLTQELVHEVEFARYATALASLSIQGRL